MNRYIFLSVNCPLSCILHSKNDGSMVSNDKKKSDHFIFLLKINCCWYLLESNRYPQHMILWRAVGNLDIL